MRQRNALLLFLIWTIILIRKKHNSMHFIPHQFFFFNLPSYLAVIQLLKSVFFLRRITGKINKNDFLCQVQKLQKYNQKSQKRWQMTIVDDIVKTISNLAEKKFLAGKFKGLAASSSSSKTTDPYDTLSYCKINEPLLINRACLFPITNKKLGQNTLQFYNYTYYLPTSFIYY